MTRATVAGTDDRLQARLWRLQRLGWAAMALVVVLALAGGFGDGWLAAATVADETMAVRLGYQRIVRAERTTRLELAAALPATATRLDVWIDRGYLAAVDGLEAMPAPARTAAAGDGVRFSFDVAPRPGPATDVGIADVRITLALMPRRPGRLAGRIAAAGAAPLPFRQWVLP